MRAETQNNVEAIRKSLATTLLLAGPLHLFYRTFHWAIRVLNGTANWILKKVFRIDPVGEAEVYLTYQRYKRARQVLRHTIRTEPDNLPAHILLLHTYFLLESSHDYCQLAATLQSKLAHRPEWAHICHVGRSLAPDHPLFQQHTH